MKNKIITGIALCSLFITGCSLDKAYLNGPNASTFPATKSEVEAGVFATYKGLTLIDASSTPFPGIQDNASDIGASRINAANYNYQQQSKLPPSNAWVTKVYTQIYKTAARANLVLDGIDNVRELMSEQEYNMYKAELLLVRSFLYDWGCQLYGDIPYIDHTLKLGDTYTRTPKEEVISRILNEDLADEMLDFLPIRHNKNSYGSARLGRAGAYGLKARICLNWKYYEEAAYYADKALKLAEEGGYSLQAYDIRYCGEDHTKGEPTPSNLFGINGHKNSDEWIWALQYNTAISSNQHNAGYYAEALEPWREVLKRDGNSQMAYIGISSALYNEGDYAGAMKYAKLAQSRNLYDKAFEGYRSEWLNKNFTWIILVVVVLIAAAVFFHFRNKKKKKNQPKNLVEMLHEGEEE